MRELLAEVQRLAGAERGEECVVFVLIHVGFFAVVFPRLAIGQLIALAAEGDDAARAFGSEDALTRVAPGAGLLAAVDGAFASALEFITHGEVIEDVPVFLLHTLLPPSDGPCADGGRVLECPQHFIHGMDGLLDEVIAGEPCVVEPVAELVFEVAPAFLPLLHPGRAAHIGPAHGAHVADLAAVDALEEFLLAIREAVAKAGEEPEALFLGLRGGGEEALHAGRIGGAGFFAEGVLAGIDALLQVLGAEAGRRGEEDDVDVLHRADFVDGVDADELVGVLDLHAGVAGLEILVRCLQAVGEDVAHGDEFGVRVGGERLARRARAASAAADEGDFEGLGHLLGAANAWEADDGGACECGDGGAEEFASGEGVELWIHGLGRGGFCAGDATNPCWRVE